MRLEEIGEFGLIARLRQRVERPDNRVLVGIGDDAAVIKTAPGELLLLTTDVLVEGVHFDRRIAGFWHIGWRAMAANVSDIAAMGGLPGHALVSICLPETVGIEDVDRIYQGMQAVADEYSFGIVGGDTVSSPRGMVLSICLTGEAAEGDLMLRDGAREGDLICVTGELGGSQAGLAMLQAELLSSGGADEPVQLEEWPQVRDRHLQPRPRLKEARLLAQMGGVHAMIDVSDGLAGEVGHIVEESGVGAEVREKDVPIGSQTRRVAEHLGGSALDYALHGGEDFELVFTVSPSDADRIGKEIRDQTGTTVSMVGKILPAEGGVVLISPQGKKTKLISEGYRHF